MKKKLSKRNFGSYSLQGLLRFFILKMTGKQYYISGKCHCCGTCCRGISLKSSQGWIRSAEEFKKMLEAYPDFKRFTIIGKDGQGFLKFSCNWLSDSGFCRDHENRLEICKIYPTVSLKFCGGEITQGCGFAIEKVIPFQKVLEKEQQKHL